MEKGGERGVQMIQNALANPQLFHFGEILAEESVQSLEKNPNPELRAWHLLLQVFASGTWHDYKIAKNPHQLSEPQIRKLKVLTITSLAARHRVLRYDELQRELELGPDVRDLEDLILDAIGAGLLEAKLDQQSQQVDVLSCSARDVSVGTASGISQLESLEKLLKAWLTNTKQTIEALDSIKTQCDKHKTTMEKLQKDLIKSIKVSEKEARTKALAVERNYGRRFDEEADLMD